MNAADIGTSITNTIINSLEAGGLPAWRKPWAADPNGLGIADANAVQILKARAASAHVGARHDAIALAALGETEYLLQIATQAKTREITVQGLCCCYSQWLAENQQDHRHEPNGSA